ncbi:hypothetical protein IQ264_23945 [Phormidium sp. LEGE 05292]|uniref:hypothetical protein n=1 Tax=[Phormidium] sp. LEGE 05292 TaxID=767427 RepID=UPI00187EB868|nr:hypothetical protein [Phormidium sp. LEGE 05292]MBE9228475.1 hypothetical protein [Phormidium sp. LEGE 05292]
MAVLWLIVSFRKNNQTIVRRAEAIARAAVQRSFDSDILVNDASVMVTCDNNGLMAPIISVKVSRSQWSNTPNIQRSPRNLLINEKCDRSFVNQEMEKRSHFYLLFNEIAIAKEFTNQ